MITDAKAVFNERSFAAGSPDDVVNQLSPYIDAGCSELVLSIADQEARNLEQLDMLTGQVLFEAP